MFKYIKMHFKSSIEYKVSFILLSISQLFNLIFSVVVILSLYNKFGVLKNINIYQCLLSLSLIDLGFYIAEFTFRGFDNFHKIIKKGNFDILLIRPENIYLQILGSEFEPTKFSRLLTGFGLLIYAFIKNGLYTNIANYFIVLLCLVCCIILYASILIFGAAVSFYTIDGIEFVNIFTYGTREIGEYPMGIFSKRVILLFTFFIPIACINYYPLLYMFNKVSNPLFILTPFAVLIVSLISILFFNFSLKHYQSSGS